MTFVFSVFLLYELRLIQCLFPVILVLTLSQSRKRNNVFGPEVVSLKTTLRFLDKSLAAYTFTLLFNIH